MSETERPGSGDFEFTADWFSRAIPLFEKVLAPWAGKPGARLLEIGSFEGRSSVWFLQRVLTGEGATLTCVDPCFSEDVEGRFLRNLARAGRERVDVRKGLSHQVLRQLPEDSFDVAYIDGSHQARDVLVDGCLAWFLVKPGGLLIFDDYKFEPSWPDELRPRCAVDAFLTAFRDEAVVVHKDYQVVVRRRPPLRIPYATRFGRYRFAWRSRTVVDETGARVELSAEETFALEELLKSRLPGEVGFLHWKEIFAARADLRRLGEKLGLVE